MPKLRRLLIRSTILCATLGIGTTVAVAWWIALSNRETNWSEQVFYFHPSESTKDYPDQYWIFDEYRTGLLAFRIQAFDRAPPFSSVQVPQLKLDLLMKKTFIPSPYGTGPGQDLYWRDDLCWPAWLPEPLQDQRYSEWSGTAAGWPFKAFYSHSYRLHNTTSQINRGEFTIIPASKFDNVNRSPHHPGTIPLLIHWPGFLANAGIYAASWWLLIGAIPLLRLATRRRAGSCPRCGYDRAGIAKAAPCPECGEKV